MPGFGVPQLSEVASGDDGTSRVFQFDVVQSVVEEAAAEEEAP